MPAPDARKVSEVNGVGNPENAVPLHNDVAIRIAFLFTGQGSQWSGMGRELINTQTAFGDSIRKSDEILNHLSKTWKLIDELQKSDDLSQIDNGFVAIPATTAVHIALVDLLKSLNISPNVVLGHSTGEIGAAYAAGILTHQDALKVAFQLGEVLQRRGLFDGRGKMLAVGLGEAESQSYLDRLQDGNACIGCENSPSSTTVSGDSAAVEELENVLQGLKIFQRRLRVPVAYHSHQMKSIEPEYLMSIDDILPSSPESIEFYSSVTGRREINGFGPSYWANNVVSKVAYRSAVQEIIDSATESSTSQLLLVEIGPQPHLRRPTEECISESGINSSHFAYFPSLLRGRDARQAIYELSQGLSMRGCLADLETIEKLVAAENATRAGGDISRAHKCSTNAFSRQYDCKTTCKNNNPVDSGLAGKEALAEAAEEVSIVGLKDDKALEAIYQSLADEISELVGICPCQYQVDVPISNYGLDSLLAMKLTEWINQKYSLTFSVGEILDAPSLMHLTQLIEMSVSPDRSIIEIQLGQEHYINGDKLALSKPAVVSPLSKSLPKLPLPDLESTLENFYRSVEAFGTDTELSRTQQTIENFKSSKDGRKLQDRLLARVNDRTLDCWLADLYNGSNFLDRNVPLVPFGSFFYTHKLAKFQHTQAERAAVITMATLQYKNDLEAGAISPDILQGQPSCTYLFQYLFNTVRKPCLGSDKMERFPGNDYIVVLRHGRVFKVPLYDNHTPIAFVQLRAIFEWILQNVDGEVSRVGILTSDERTSWAKIRESLRTLNPQNAEYLHAIEAAAFLICLDDASPGTASDRAHHFHFGDGTNRWNDKSVQFAVCTNGTSGFIGDHSMLDAGTVLGLNRFVTRAILEHQYEPDTSTQMPDDITAYIKEEKLVTTPQIELQINRVTHDFNANIKDANHIFFTLSNFGGRLCRLYKFPPKSLFQLIVALTSNFFFGNPVPALWETVSLGNFYKGRVEINQVISPPVIRFLDAAQDICIPVAERRQLLFDATKSHAASVMRAVRGRGVDRHITSLRQMVQEGETVPPLFTDPLYVRTRPRKIMSHCYETGMAEKGFLFRDPDAIWVHYEVEDESVDFSITGRGDGPQQFRILLERAAEIVRELVVA